MRIDFHFYTIYALARAVGFSPENAYVIAYASQYTDDEVTDKTILFENGGQFEPFITAHKIFNPQNLLKDDCKRIWIPFHFLPGTIGEGDEQILTKPDCTIIQRMIDQFLSYDLLPYSRHLLGIMLHAYADSWSHQNFMGIIADINKVNDLKVNGEDIMLYRIAPPLGHAQTGSTPDDPSLEWEYSDSKGEFRHIINHDRAIDAAHHCYLMLSRFINKFADDFLDSRPIPWDQIQDKIMELFQGASDLKDCINAWGNAISNNEIGFNSHDRDINLIYDEGEWFNIAIKSESRMNPESGQFEDYYYRNEIYEVSDLKYFNDSAQFYWSTLFVENAKILGLKDYFNL